MWQSNEINWIFESHLLKSIEELSYKQFVLPAVLDYASSIWDPSYHQNQINKLEMIQNRAARFVLNQPWRRNVRDSISSLLSSLSGQPYNFEERALV